AHARSVSSATPALGSNPIARARRASPTVRVRACVRESACRALVPGALDVSGTERAEGWFTLSRRGSPAEDRHDTLPSCSRCGTRTSPSSKYN
ncbi:Short-wave-sensitive opsin 1, partial [Frankliniella fusca]